MDFILCSLLLQYFFCVSTGIDYLSSSSRTLLDNHNLISVLRSHLLSPKGLLSSQSLNVLFLPFCSLFLGDKSLNLLQKYQDTAKQISSSNFNPLHPAVSYGLDMCLSVDHLSFFLCLGNTEENKVQIPIGEPMHDL